MIRSPRPILIVLAALSAVPLMAQTRAGTGEATDARVGFSSSLAIAGDEVFVGRRGSPFTPVGAIHVFRRGADGTWSEQAAVSSGGLEPADGFGSSLAVRGDVMAVGAPGSAEGGRVILFERRDGAWRAVSRLQPGQAAGAEFGSTLAFSDDLLIVGAPGQDSARGVVFAAGRRPDGVWGAMQLVGRGAAPGDRFGAALAVHGDRVLIGVPGTVRRRPGEVPAPGRAVVYRAQGATWVEDGRLEAPADAVGFGSAVAFVGDEAWVGAPGATRGNGAVYVHRRDAGGWTTLRTVAPDDGGALARFGSSVASDGVRVLVGAPGQGPREGAVHVYERVGGVWAARHRLADEALARGTQFGNVVALAGDLAVVGAPNADFGEGSAALFTRDRATGAWSSGGILMDAPVSLPAVTGGMVRCDSASGEAAGFACGEVDLLSFLPVSAIGGRRGIQLNDIWGWTDPETGGEYALVGRMDGTSFVDVTDPTAPRYLGDLPMTPGARANVWRDIKTYRDHAYIVADGSGQHGMQVFDLTRLRQVREPRTFTADTVYDRIASAHNIAINEESGFAYTIGNSGGGETCGGALHMIDIREPKNPQFAGCFADPATGRQRTGYTHDNQCVMYQGPDTRYRGREICFNASETAVGIADVTDKANPRALAVASYPNTAYAHQGWLTEDHRYFFLNDEGDEISGLVARTRTLVWDMARLDEPVLLTEFLGETGASDHNLYIRGQYMYQSNYAAGLRVIDISDPAKPREVGHFDTVPWGENAPGFDGSWSNYPFFRSGTIVVTSQGEGLFVLRHRQMPLVP